MKKYPFAIGIISLLTSATAFAQTCPESDTAKNLLTITPVGEYTRLVLERATKGIAEAQAAQAGLPKFGSQYFGWASKITGALLGLVDTQLRLVEYERDLTQTTACMHLDLALIEAKMEEVRCETRKAAKVGSSWGVMQLLSLQNFLNNRYKYLTMGATDPYFKDPDWQEWQIFDPEEDGWCCPDANPNNMCEFMNVKDCRFKKYGRTYATLDACSTACKRPESPPSQPPAREEICPFDTDYLPATGAGYGCSVEVLNGVAGYAPAQEERDAMQNFITERDDFLTATNIAKIKDAYVKMLNFQGRPIPPEIENFGKSYTTPHLRRLDCRANKTADMFGIAPVQDNLKNTWPQGAISITKRGPFAYSEDTITVLRAFFGLSQKWSLLREFADYLEDPYELPEGTDRDNAIERDATLLGLGRNIRQFVRSLIVRVDKNQGGLESAIFPKASDGQLQLITIMEPLRPVMSVLAKSVTTPQEGIRGFAKNYAYYLRRSCIFRTCSDRLEKIIKILIAPECFPYTTGAYTSGKWWEQCENAIK